MLFKGQLFLAQFFLMSLSIFAMSDCEQVISRGVLDRTTPDERVLQEVVIV